MSAAVNHPWNHFVFLLRVKPNRSYIMLRVVPFSLSKLSKLDYGMTNRPLFFTWLKLKWGFIVNGIYKFHLPFDYEREVAVVFKQGGRQFVKSLNLSDCNFPWKWMLPFHLFVFNASPTICVSFFVSQYNKHPKQRIEIVFDTICNIN